MNTVFRQAVREDIPVIEELFREMLRSVSGSANVEGYEEGYLDKFFSDSGDIIYAAEAEGRIVGYISVEACPDYIYLDDLSPRDTAAAGSVQS